MNKRRDVARTCRSFAVICTILAAIIPFGTALAFVKRTEAPDAQTYIKQYKASQNDVSNNQIPKLDEGSTFYAWARANEIIREVYPDKNVQYEVPYNKKSATGFRSFSETAAEWYAVNQLMNEGVGAGVADRGFLFSEGAPIAGSFAVWGASATNPDGHVAVVESVEGDFIEISEAIWRPNEEKPHFQFSTHTLTLKEIKARTDAGDFQGFIYFLDPINGISANIRKILELKLRHLFVAEGDTATLLVTTTADVNSISLSSPFGAANRAVQSESTLNADGTRSWHLRWYDAHKNGYGDGTLWMFSITAYVGDVAAEREDGITIKVIPKSH
ncbi:MAG: CHAP domain-containing protein [Oscillospiraceae bacterium]|jgi:surface antigen|nr:CHAP domain-containing protein [Oscillospiraceae bacterium]